MLYIEMDSIDEYAICILDLWSGLHKHEIKRNGHAFRYWVVNARFERAFERGADRIRESP